MNDTCKKIQRSTEEIFVVITDEEEKYRIENNSCIKTYVEEVYVTSELKCTICKQIISINHIHTHPALRVLICASCDGKYEKSVFLQNEDGTDKNCRWCSKPVLKYNCSYCTCVFCERCLRLNFGDDYINNVKSKWKCFICQPNQLWWLRAICAGIMDNIIKNQKQIQTELPSTSKQNFPSDDVLQKRLMRNRRAISITQIDEETCPSKSNSDIHISNNDEWSTDSSDEEHKCKNRFSIKNVSKNPTVDNLNEQESNEIFNKLSSFVTSVQNELNKTNEIWTNHAQKKITKNYLKSFSNVNKVMTNLILICESVSKNFQNNINDIKKEQNLFEKKLLEKQDKLSDKTKIEQTSNITNRVEIEPTEVKNEVIEIFPENEGMKKEIIETLPEKNIINRVRKTSQGIEDENISNNLIEPVKTENIDNDGKLNKQKVQEATNYTHELLKRPLVEIDDFAEKKRRKPINRSSLSLSLKPNTNETESDNKITQDNKSTKEPSKLKSEVNNNEKLKNIETNSLNISEINIKNETSLNVEQTDKNKPNSPKNIYSDCPVKSEPIESNTLNTENTFLNQTDNNQPLISQYEQIIKKEPTTLKNTPKNHYPSEEIKSIKIEKKTDKPQIIENNTNSAKLDTSNTTSEENSSQIKHVIKQEISEEVIIKMENLDTVSEHSESSVKTLIRDKCFSTGMTCLEERIAEDFGDEPEDIQEGNTPEEDNPYTGNTESYEETVANIFELATKQESRESYDENLSELATKQENENLKDDNIKEENPSNSSEEPVNISMEERGNKEMEVTENKEMNEIENKGTEETKNECMEETVNKEIEETENKRMENKEIKETENKIIKEISNNEESDTDDDRSSYSEGAILDAYIDLKYSSSMSYISSESSSMDSDSEYEPETPGRVEDLKLNPLPVNSISDLLYKPHFEDDLEGTYYDGQDGGTYKLKSCYVNLIESKKSVEKWLKNNFDNIDLEEREINRLTNMDFLKRRSRSRTSSNDSNENPKKKQKFTKDSDSDLLNISDADTEVFSESDLLKINNGEHSDSSVKQFTESISDDSCMTLSDDEPNIEENTNKKETTNKKEDSDLQKEGNGSTWRDDPLLRQTLTIDSDDTYDSDVEETLNKEERNKKLTKKKNLSDDEKPNIITSDTSDSDDSDCQFVSVTQNSSTNSKRKNIRKVLSDDVLEEATKQALKEEQKRKERLAKNQLSLESFISQTSLPEEKVGMILDLDDDKKPIVSINAKLTEMLKPHQREGIKFMWQICFESVKRMKEDSGTGCILAHCMGLGKTRQVVVLSHTLLTHKILNIKHIMIVCPLSLVLNWLEEYRQTFRVINAQFININEIRANISMQNKINQIKRWQRMGGVLIIGYDTFQSLLSEKSKSEQHKAFFKEALISPGPDLIVCDEGHMLKSGKTLRCKALTKVQTKRRIILTGTPLQNNLKEYYHMVNFVKPNLLGTEAEYSNRFVNPITNGQFEDSFPEDIILMRKRAHVLHKKLETTVQRYESSELEQYMPKKLDYVLYVPLCETQIKFYQYYLNKLDLDYDSLKRKMLFPDYHNLQNIWTHPAMLTLKLNKKIVKQRKNYDIEEVAAELDPDRIDPNQDLMNMPWFQDLCPDDLMTNIKYGPKIEILFEIAKECSKLKEKLLVFTSSVIELDLIENFLRQAPVEHIGERWIKNKNYFRMDGTIEPEKRNRDCATFNNRFNKDAKLFLISHKVGGLGLNLYAANRVVLMDVSWNPSYDSQSIYRSYRFGQEKTVYVYRLVAMGTMEEVLYSRGITKLAISRRVVDEQQISRQFKSDDLQKMYQLETNYDKERPTPEVPQDRLLANLLNKFNPTIYKYNEHKRLLAQLPHEELNEEDRKAAWEEFKREEEFAKQNNMLSEQIGQPLNLTPNGANLHIPNYQNQFHNFAYGNKYAQRNYVNQMLNNQYMQNDAMYNQLNYNQQYLPFFPNRYLRNNQPNHTNARVGQMLSFEQTIQNNRHRLPRNMASRHQIQNNFNLNLPIPSTSNAQNNHRRNSIEHRFLPPNLLPNIPNTVLSYENNNAINNVTTNNMIIQGNDLSNPNKENDILNPTRQLSNFVSNYIEDNNIFPSTSSTSLQNTSQINPQTSNPLSNINHTPHNKQITAHNKPPDASSNPSSNTNLIDNLNEVFSARDNDSETIYKPNTENNVSEVHTNTTKTFVRPNILKRVDSKYSARKSTTPTAKTSKPQSELPEYYKL